MIVWAEIWVFLAYVMHLAGAVSCTLAATWILRIGDRDRTDRHTVVMALLLTAAWSVSHAAFGPISWLTTLLEVVRNLAWIAVLYRMFANDGRHQSMRPIRPVVISLVFVQCLQGGLLIVAASQAFGNEFTTLALQAIIMFRILVAVGALVLLHNLYVGASHSVRQVLRWSVGALAALWTFDLNVYTIAYLGGGLSAELVALRGLVVSLVAISLAIGSRRNAAELRLRPSRAVTFQTLSLLIIGAYLVLMVGLAQSLAMVGGDLGRLTQVGFTIAATAFALLWLPSQRLRGWVRVTAVKHLFQHRYDYRAEWLRFAHTIAKQDNGEQSLHQRAVKAMADITDSPSGLLFMPGENGTLEIAARWRWPDFEVPADPFSAELLRLIEQETFIIDADDVRKGKDQHGETSMIPQWFIDDSRAWAMVPLMHFDRMLGAIILARPAEPRPLDWEDFDLLKVVGQQLASHLSEHAGQQALMEAARFDEFNRRIAFVMHDIKNLASQLSLLARNAERHADKPDFRDDMLVTLRNSADKLNTLLARLNRYGASSKETLQSINLAQCIERLAQQYEWLHKVDILRCEKAVVKIDPDGFEQALTHLIQNAIDTSSKDTPVSLEVTCDSTHGKVCVIDCGEGMSAEFIRSGLFKPFVSSKPSGFGIGAYEARELIHSMGGRLEVDSREGLGTRFIITFPLAAVATLAETDEFHALAEAS